MELDLFVWLNWIRWLFSLVDSDSAPSHTHYLTYELRTSTDCERGQYFLIMKHGEHYEKNGNEYMNDHINGTDWHVPDDSEPIINEDGSWNDNPREKYSWEE